MTVSRVGVDKIVISLQLKKFKMDKSKLLKVGAELYENNFNEPYVVFKDTDGKSVYLNYLKLTNKGHKGLPFNTLMIGSSKNDIGQWITYTKIDITLPNVLGNTNEKAIEDVKTLKEIFEIIKDKLLECGLDIDFNTSLIQEIEINKNIYLSDKFSSYRYVIEYMNSLISDRLKTDISASYNYHNGYSGFKIGNKSKSLKFYDKRKAIKNIYGVDIKKELLRVEFRLLNSTTVKNELGYNTIGELIKDEFKSVEMAYNSMFNKEIYKHLVKDIDKQLKVIEEELKSQSRMNINAIIDKKPLDIELVLYAMKNTRKKNNYARDSKNLIDTIYKKQKDSSVLVDMNEDNYFNNLNKINEIIYALGFEKIEFKLSKTVKNKLNDTIKQLKK